MRFPLLPPEQELFVEAVAQRVLQLLDEREQRPASGLVDAQPLAGILGVARSTVYEHAADFGAVQLGTGPRARMRFDVEKAREAWTRRDTSESSQVESPEPAGVVRRRRRPAARVTAGLLPVRGEEAL